MWCFHVVFQWSGQPLQNYWLFLISICPGLDARVSRRPIQP